MRHTELSTFNAFPSLPPASQPSLCLAQACVDAHAEVIMWSSWTDFFSSSVLLLLLAPVVGHWTDAHGRKPFIVLTCLAAAPPVLCLVLYVQYGVSLMYALSTPCSTVWIQGSQHELWRGG